MKKLPRLRTLLMFSLLYQSLMGLVSAAEPLAVGATAPAIKGINQDGKSVDLGEQYKKGYVLVYFYPKAGTPGCTAEACSLRDAFADLTKLNLTVIGVSHDSVEAQKKFADAQKLPFDLLADTKSDIYNAFGVPGLTRQSFLMKDGKVIWNELKASTAEQANNVKKALADDRAKAATPAKTDVAKPSASASPSAASATK